MQLRFERRMLPHIPWGLVAAAVLLGLVGVFNLASATRGLGAPLWKSQALYLAVGVLATATVSLVDYRFLQRMALPIFVANLLALLALKLFGHTAKGAESWFALGPLRVQPAEFMKIGLLLMLAKFFHDEQRSEGAVPGVLRELVLALIIAAPVYLVLKQPDLGTAMMMSLSSVTLVLFARPRLWLIGLLFGGLLLGGLVVWNDWIRDQTEPKVTLVRGYLKKHQEARISGWLDPESDPKGTNYHSLQSKIAVGSGGLTGKGWKKGTQAGNFFLPEQHTDFVFSVWAEEHGFLACLVLLFLYGFVLLSALGVALSARDRFGAFVAVGVAVMIFWQVFQNIGMVTGLMPVTGITLPLMSYGGSSMVSVMIGVGLLVNIGMRRHLFTG
ncbi:MAG: rod shape-determining protein RodA [Myxococcales bacterium]|nr:rod shape-determining protein RodA [Myxococcales bacterium]